MRITARVFLFSIVLVVLFFGAAAFFTQEREVTLVKEDETDFIPKKEEVESAEFVDETLVIASAGDSIVDIEPQEPLSNPPEIIKAIYATSWSASSATKMNYLIGLINDTELNAIVIDTKDYSGYVSYDTDLEVVESYGAEEIRIPKINALIKQLHDNNIYTIARVSVFQDERLAFARPDLALMSSSTGETWKDYKGVEWMDSAGQETWEYNVAIANEALERGFDEVNFDYIRFASDGDLSDIVYPFWDETTFKTHIIRDFWEYVKSETPEGRATSADLFGLTTVNYDGLGIGQHLEYAFENFGDIAPMVYPSHYASGAFGYSKPAENPYEIVFNSMKKAVQRRNTYIADFGTSTVPAVAKLRPWLQDFDLGADYTADMVRAQIDATYDAAADSPEAISGWMLWNPSNIYTKEALLGPEE